MALQRRSVSVVICWAALLAVMQFIPQATSRRLHCTDSPPPPSPSWSPSPSPAAQDTPITVVFNSPSPSPPPPSPSPPPPSPSPPPPSLSPPPPSPAPPPPSPRPSPSPPSPRPSPSPSTKAPTPTPAGAWPKAATRVNLNRRSIPVVTSFDGGMTEFYGAGTANAFELEDGAILTNVIIGASAVSGVRCKGSCTLKNVWWPNVGQTAATFAGNSSSTNCVVDGGGAKQSADGIVFQFNGAGTVTVKNFQVDGFTRFFRTCGNCTQQFKRTVKLSNIVATVSSSTSYFVGINTNYNDVLTAEGITIKNDPQKKLNICAKFQGTTRGSPIMSNVLGPDGKNCIYNAGDIKYE